MVSICTIQPICVCAMTYRVQPRNCHECFCIITDIWEFPYKLYATWKAFKLLPRRLPPPFYLTGVYISCVCHVFPAAHHTCTHLTFNWMKWILNANDSLFLWCVLDAGLCSLGRINKPNTGAASTTTVMWPLDQLQPTYQQTIIFFCCCCRSRTNSKGTVWWGSWKCPFIGFLEWQSSVVSHFCQSFRTGER